MLCIGYELPTLCTVSLDKRISSLLMAVINGQRPGTWQHEFRFF